MALLDILEFPDPRLRRMAKPVDVVGESEKALAEAMIETMYAARGIGLASIQVNDDRRVFVMDVSDEHNQPQVFFNPEIIERSGEQVCEEGCLSIPGITADVQRADSVRVRALDITGESFELEVDGLAAVCIQHEIDHLDGKVFFDRLSPLKRRVLQKRYQKQRQVASETQ
ncbi:MAG TPA: peptide deformylase [Wenzhouxiangella sp.]